MVSLACLVLVVHWRVKILVIVEVIPAIIREAK